MTKIKHSCEIGPQAYSIGKKAPFDKKGYLYWHVPNYSKDLGKFQQLLTLEDAFQKWEDHLVILKFRRTPDIKKAHIIIYWTDEDGNCYDESGKFIRKCPVDFNGQYKNAIAVAYPNGEIYCNDNKYHVVKGEGRGYELLITFCHEIGHVLGFRHTTHSDDIMGDQYNKNAEFTIDTKTGAIVLYKDPILEAIQVQLDSVGIKQPEMLADGSETSEVNRFPPNTISQ